MRTDPWFITAARSSAAGRGAPLSIHNGLSIRDERCLNSELVVHDRGWIGRGVEDSCRGSADDRHGRRPLRLPGPGRAGAGQLLQMWMREIQMCGRRNYDETKNEAGGVD